MVEEASGLALTEPEHRVWAAFALTRMPVGNLSKPDSNPAGPRQSDA